MATALSLPAIFNANTWTGCPAPVNYCLACVAYTFTGHAEITVQSLGIFPEIMLTYS